MRAEAKLPLLQQPFEGSRPAAASGGKQRAAALPVGPGGARA